MWVPSVACMAETAPQKWETETCTACTAAYRSVYDAAKRLITGSEDAHDDTLAVQLVAGGLAGGAAAGACLLMGLGGELEILDVFAG